MQKRIVQTSVLIALLASGVAYADQPKVDVRVDPAAELTAIIFRLAGHHEYNQCQLPRYANAVDEYFADHKDHPIMAFAASLPKRSSISYDAVMSMGVHLKAEGNRISPRVPWQPRPALLEGRWKVADAERFAKLADDFAQKSKFQDFLAKQKPLYDDLTQQMRQTLNEHAKLEWFDTYFGKRENAQFHVLISPTVGTNNYGVRCRVGKTDHLYAVMGVWDITFFTGKPRMSKKVLPTVIHEFAHSYCNPIIDRHAKKLKQSARVLFAPRKQQMYQQAYSNWHTMMYESLVRAVETRYMWDTQGVKAGMASIRHHHRRGFTWTGDLTSLLAEYAADRKTYPTFDHFMPRVIEFFNQQARNETTRQ